MKRTIIFLLLSVWVSLSTYGQKENQIPQKKVITETVHVSGVCDECKERIENAAYIKGVKRADWDQNTQELTVTYRTDKTSLLDIEKHIAGVGHDTQDVKADEEAYKKLPQCCAYHEQEAH